MTAYIQMARLLNVMNHFVQKISIDYALFNNKLALTEKLNVA